ncbi:M20/M25/M40 family metallo-hydrolase, partial [Flavihumibacter sp. CACIAM 22H1]|uniref:M20/M25/M40 family metallo-hydrolase n=1 Tax=Flavihumibacter sp. CACIAM 22H1 TaxID=1812911 RepID=UPI00344F9963
MRLLNYFIAILFCLPCRTVVAQTGVHQVNQAIAANSSYYTSTYQYLHANPELSRAEINTAAFLKKEMKNLGWELVDSLGYQSFAAILRNGKGPTILYRTDMDGLPLKELTGLPFASKGSAMHACGHDVHMSSWLGTAQLLTRLK